MIQAMAAIYSTTKAVTVFMDTHDPSDGSNLFHNEGGND